MFSVAAGAEAPAPCTSTPGACTEWVTLGGGPARALIYRSYSLDVRNERVTRLLVMVHGKNRDADNYYSTAMAAAFLAHAIDDTAIVAPYMASSARDCEDPVTPPQVDFSCTGDSWRAGASALTVGAVTGEEFDALVRPEAMLGPAG